MKKILLYSVICAVTAIFSTGCGEETTAEKVDKSYTGSMKKATDSAQSLSDQITKKSNQALESIE